MLLSNGMTQDEQTLNTIKLLSMQNHEIELNPNFPNGNIIVKANEIIIDELIKLIDLQRRNLDTIKHEQIRCNLPHSESSRR